MTRDEYTKALQDAAKEIQGDNYAGNNYYDQDAWDVAFEDGIPANEAVLEDMGYWS
jgi:hypothetical protein